MQIVDVNTMRAVESAAIATGTSGYTFMKRAGNAAARFIRKLVRKYGFSRVVFVAGGGNNAGDALVAASNLFGEIPISLIMIRPPDMLKGEAAMAANALPNGLKISLIKEPDELEFYTGDLIVDALLGIGISGVVRKDIAEIISRINESQLPVLALDLPSGMDADSGIGKTENADAVHAKWTLTFGLPKRGLFASDGIRFSGILHVADIGMKEFAPPSSENAFSWYDAFQTLPRYDTNVYKNQRGVLNVMAGSRCYPGAVELAAHAGLRGGAGIIRAFYPRNTDAKFPSAVIPVEVPGSKTGCFSQSPDWQRYSADALVAGPGWGKHVSRKVLENVLAFPGKVLLDADGLNVLAKYPDVPKAVTELVITPHMGEAARLCKAFGVSIDQDRVNIAMQLAKAIGAVVVLKGARTIVANVDGNYSFNTSGSHALATAGSGDVLSGIIGAMLANGLNAVQSAQLGVFIHGVVGEECGRAAIADDLVIGISRILNDLEMGTLV